MRYLLDTCAAIWFFEGSDRIPVRLLDMLRAPDHEVFVSDASILELVIKHQLGKCPLPQPPSRILPALIRRHGFDSLPISASHVYALESLPMLHRDPFDRLLVAQCRTEKMTLATPDALVTQYDVPTLWG